MNLKIYDFAVGGIPLSLRKLVKFEFDGGKTTDFERGWNKTIYSKKLTWR